MQHMQLTVRGIGVSQTIPGYVMRILTETRPACFYESQLSIDVAIRHGDNGVACRKLRKTAATLVTVDLVAPVATQAMLKRHTPALQGSES